MTQKIRHIAIVSLSRGILGESFVRHELDIGLRRLREKGVDVTFMPHALKGLDYTAAHPEDRARDLLAALTDDSIDMILCAVGGDDTYRLLPYLFDHDELQNAVKGHRKAFLGFSDTTMNHFMLHKVGLNTFYGQAFLPDICELDKTMLPYTEAYFNELLATGTIDALRPSNVWYNSRTDFDVSAVGTSLPVHDNDGFCLLQGSPFFKGEILGGCIDTIYDMFDGTRYSDSPALCRKYRLFPDEAEWKGKILLLESSEETAPPEKYRAMLTALKKTGVFNAVSGVLVGKPVDEIYHEDYKRLLVEVIDNSELPILCNLSIGHALPRCIIPLGVPAAVDAEKQIITFGKD